MVDFPHSTRAKKYFLVLMVGTSTHVPQVQSGGTGGSRTMSPSCRVGRGVQPVVSC